MLAGLFECQSRALFTRVHRAHSKGALAAERERERERACLPLRTCTDRYRSGRPMRNRASSAALRISRFARKITPANVDTKWNKPLPFGPPPPQLLCALPLAPNRRHPQACRGGRQARHPRESPRPPCGDSRALRHQSCCTETGAQARTRSHVPHSRHRPTRPRRRSGGRRGGRAAEQLSER